MNVSDEAMAEVIEELVARLRTRLRQSQVNIDIVVHEIFMTQPLNVTQSMGDHFRAMPDDEFKDIWGIEKTELWEAVRRWYQWHASR